MSKLYKSKECDKMLLPKSRKSARTEKAEVSTVIIVQGSASKDNQKTADRMTNTCMLY
jgi:hypothetical protein